MKKLLCLALCLCLLLATLPAAALAYDVVLSPQKLMVNGQYYECEKYNIDGANYFKLRDIACLLNETANTFAVSWDPDAGAVIIAPGFPYEPVGGELIVGADRSATAVPSAQTVWYLDAPVDDLSAFNIGGNNFFKLRDLGNLIGFDVDYDSATNTAIVETLGYAGKNAADKAAAFQTLWDWIAANADRDIMGKEYDETEDYANGDSAMLSLIDTEAGTIAVVLSYVYANGDYDRTWIYLHPEADDYYAVYSYYADGDEPGFTGTLELDPAAFDAAKSTEFFDVEGELTGLQGYDFWNWASVSFGCTLAWLDEVFGEVPGLKDVSVYDFGFTDAGLDFRAQERAATARAEAQSAAYYALFAWAEANANDTVEGYPAYTKQELLVGAGANVSTSLVAAKSDAGEALALYYTYTYDTGDTDAAYLFLGSESQTYYAGYEHYAPGASEPDFYGSFTVDAASFNGNYPVDFDETEGAKVGTDFAVSARYLATCSICDMLLQLDELCQLVVTPHEAYGIADFGFSTPRLSTAELYLN